MVNVATHSQHSHGPARDHTAALYWAVLALNAVVWIYVAWLIGG